jgi:HK97 family phage prohead protease
MLYKGTRFLNKDIDLGKRTAVIAYATYNSLDRDGDIASKGMFSKSWNESHEDIRFFKNHNKDILLGSIERFWEDDNHAYAMVKMSKSRDGEDALIQMDEGILKDASYGFEPIKSTPIQNKGRKFSEVKLWEISALTHWGAHPESGVREVNKTAIKPDAEFKELAERIIKMETLARNSKASDESIEELLIEIEAAKAYLSKYDTAPTQKDDDQNEPDASGNDEKEFADALTLLTLKI